MIKKYKDMNEDLLCDVVERKILFILNDLVCKNKNLIPVERVEGIEELVNIGGEYVIAYEMLFSVIFHSKCILSGEASLFFIELSIILGDSVDYDTFYSIE